MLTSHQQCLHQYEFRGGGTTVLASVRAPGVVQLTTHHDHHFLIGAVPFYLNCEVQISRTGENLQCVMTRSHITYRFGNHVEGLVPTDAEKNAIEEELVTSVAALATQHPAEIGEVVEIVDRAERERRQQIAALNQQIAQIESTIAIATDKRTALNETIARYENRLATAHENLAQIQGS